MYENLYVELKSLEKLNRHERVRGLQRESN